MERKIFEHGAGRATAIFLAALLGLTGCVGAQSGMQGAGQSAESGTSTGGSEGNGTGGAGSQGAASGLNADAEPVVRELYDIMTVPYMRLQAYGDNADAALDLGVEKIKSINDLLSTGDPESEIGKLNASGQGVLGEDAACLMEKSLGLYEETEGAFDVSVYPLMELWGFTTLYKESLEEAIEEAERKVKSDESQEAERKVKSDESQEAERKVKSDESQEAERKVESDESQESGTREAPSDADIQETLKKVGLTKIDYDAESGQINMPEGMKIDFGGIAKGYASQSVAEILREAGITSALMDLGGNIQTVGRKPDGSKWRIALNDRNHGGFLGILTVENCAVITSGGYERNFEDAEGNVYHHILDPKTGYPVNNGFSTDSSVTIVCEDGTMADALSTAMYVLGPEKAAEYWRAHSDAFQMIMMTDKDKMYVTEGVAEDYQSDYKFEVIKKA